MSAEKPKKSRKYIGAPISEEEYQHLEKKYGKTADELKQIVKQFRYSRPKLEAYLVVEAHETKKKP